MSIIQSVVLGIIQGIGEFLPISSSAHLILLPYLFNWQKSTLAFDVSLHFGTLLAVIIIFSKEWLNLFITAIKPKKQLLQSQNPKMFWYLIIATIPAAIAGLLLDDLIEKIIRDQIWLIALLLAIMGILIYIGDKWASKHYKQKETTFTQITLKQAFIIGCSQTFAIFPGFSRSGTTILIGRLLGLEKEAITKFTFLLSVPIIAGATILKIGDLTLTIDVVIGILTSFIVGILSIKFLLKYIKKHDFSVFALHRIIIAIIVYIKLIWF